MYKKATASLVLYFVFNLDLMGCQRAAFLWRIEADRYFASGVLIMRDRRVSRVLSQNRRRGEGRAVSLCRNCRSDGRSQSHRSLSHSWSGAVTQSLIASKFARSSGVPKMESEPLEQVSVYLSACSDRLRPDSEHEPNQCRHHQQAKAMFEKGTKSELEALT